jgi:uncharacterized protein (DUF2236 family)
MTIVDDALVPVRSWLAEQIRSRVVGGDQPELKNSAVIETPGPRWFDDDAVIKRVHADAAMFIGGLRALLLQSLHPLAMAGVAQHSDYRTDPWGRLQRTADFLAATTFGPADMAERAVAHQGDGDGRRWATVRRQRSAPDALGARGRG